MTASARRPFILQSSQRRQAASLLCALSLLVAQPSSFPSLAEAQVRPVYSRGAAGMAQILGRLRTTASLLQTAAHPDDEDTALIARTARGDHARVAYLSITRGEGGQNAIGPELGEALGVIRTEELLQARALDGGEQFFTRAFDYGFSKTLDEAVRKWGKDEVLGDVVRIIRTYRPLVIASRFSGTDTDGHGQHQYAGHIVPEAFRAAADPSRFPEQIAEGLRPWKAKRLLAGDFSRREGSVVVETGIYDPVLGRTYYEIAAEGRSQHKSQEMGALELRGPQATAYRLVEGMPFTGDGMFGGIDTSLVGIASLAGLPEGVITAELAQIQSAVERATAEYNALRPAEILPHLAEGLRVTRRARAKLREGKSPAYAEADFLLSHKEEEFEEALGRAAGVVLDATAGTATVVGGDTLQAAVRLFVPQGSPVAVKKLELRAPRGWKSEAAAEPPVPQTGFRRTRESAPHAAYYRVTVPRDAPVTTPYFLEQARQGDRYVWGKEAPQGRPFEPALLHGVAELEAHGVAFTATAPVQYRYADDIRGELRRAVDVVPAASIALDPPLWVVPSGTANSPGRTNAPVSLTARVCSNAARELAGEVSLQVPAHWNVEPAKAAFALRTQGECATSQFQVTAPGGLAQGRYPIDAEARWNGEAFRQRQQVIAYPHINTHRIYQPARTEVVVANLKVAPVKVGYIMGSGDEVPEAIRRMGLPVTLLDENELSTGDLSRFDVIVVGIKAANVRPDFVANNGRLLNYMRHGGTLIVQFQQEEYMRNRMPPYPASIESRSPGRARVAEETAPVKILEPDHPALSFPNRITEADFEGWVHERSLYNFTTFAPEYVPLLESGDTGEAGQRGGHLYAEVGKGRYVYTSYVWFRQLPAGVPGAYRLFANLLSLPKAPKARP
jgi:LmbE family N-acetylglucosaminyl deacetylase